MSGCSTVNVCYFCTFKTLIILIHISYFYGFLKRDWKHQIYLLASMIAEAKNNCKKKDELSGLYKWVLGSTEMNICGTGMFDMKDGKWKVFPDWPPFLSSQTRYTALFISLSTTAASTYMRPPTSVSSSSYQIVLIFETSPRTSFLMSSLAPYYTFS